MRSTWRLRFKKSPSFCSHGTLALALSLCSACSGLITLDPDRALLNALNSENLSRFERLLKKGADPNAIFGPNTRDWVERGALMRLTFTIALTLTLMLGGACILGLPAWYVVFGIQTLSKLSF